MLIKLPGLNMVNNYEQFFKYLIRKIPNTKKCKIDVTKVYVNEKNGGTLANHIKKQLRKENKHLTKYGFDTSWGYHYLNYSPAYRKDVPLGYAIIEDNVFTK